MHSEPSSSSSPASDPAEPSASVDAPPRSQLALRRVAIDTWRENVAYLHRDCAVYRAEGFQALPKTGVPPNARRTRATVTGVAAPPMVGCNELGRPPRCPWPGYG